MGKQLNTRVLETRKVSVNQGPVRKIQTDEFEPKDDELVSDKALSPTVNRLKNNIRGLSAGRGLEVHDSSPMAHRSLMQPFEEHQHQTHDAELSEHLEFETGAHPILDEMQIVTEQTLSAHETGESHPELQTRISALQERLNNIDTGSRVFNLTEHMILGTEFRLCMRSFVCGSGKWVLCAIPCTGVDGTDPTFTVYKINLADKTFVVDPIISAQIPSEMGIFATIGESHMLLTDLRGEKENHKTYLAHVSNDGTTTIVELQGEFLDSNGDTVQASNYFAQNTSTFMLSDSVYINYVLYVIVSPAVSSFEYKRVVAAFTVDLETATVFTQQLFNYELFSGANAACTPMWTHEGKIYFYAESSNPEDARLCPICVDTETSSVIIMPEEDTMQDIMGRFLMSGAVSFRIDNTYFQLGGGTHRDNTGSSLNAHNNMQIQFNKGRFPRFLVETKKPWKDWRVSTASLPVGLSGAAVHVWDDAAYVFGGYDSTWTINTKVFKMS